MDETRDAARLLEFPASELLLGQVHGKVADWWTLGIFLYELLTGMPLFYAKQTEEVHRTSHPHLSSNSFDKNTNDLLLGLLRREPELRLGTNGTFEVKDHAFFHDIDWQRLLRGQVEPPLKPTFKPGEITTMQFKNETHRHPPSDEVGMEAERRLLTGMDESMWSALLGEDDELFKKFHPPGFFERLVRASDWSLIHAVIQGDHGLVMDLVKEVERVSRTKALGLAVERGDTDMIRLLLDHGANGDFDDSDRPRPSLGTSCSFGRGGDETEPTEFWRHL